VLLGRRHELVDGPVQPRVILAGPNHQQGRAAPGQAPGRSAAHSRGRRSGPAGPPLVCVSAQRLGLAGHLPSLVRSPRIPFAAVS
jgi:hypothetical protein